MNPSASNANLLKVLPYAGVLPFLIGAVLFGLGIKTLPLLGSVSTLVLGYGLVILPFMAGVHWGQHLSGVRGKWNLLLTSNALTLIAWISFTALSPAWFALVLAGLFILLLAIDWQLALAGKIEQDYFKTRCGVTALVVLSLLVFSYLLA